ncbi:MAG: tetratricopeptide repeat protein [Ostreibacterium sp.]
MDKILEPSSTFWAIELTALVAIVTLCILIYAIRQNTLTLRSLNDRVKFQDEKEEVEQFNSDKAEKWFEKGDIKALKTYCKRFIEQTPNSVHANWYYALGYYNQGDYEAAREYFENVIRINPLWRDGAIVYLQEIAEKIGLPDTQTLH